MKYSNDVGWRARLWAGVGLAIGHLFLALVSQWLIYGQLRKAFEDEGVSQFDAAVRLPMFQSENLLVAAVLAVIAVAGLRRARWCVYVLAFVCNGSIVAGHQFYLRFFEPWNWSIVDGVMWPHLVVPQLLAPTGVGLFIVLTAFLLIAAGSHALIFRDVTARWLPAIPGWAQLVLAAVVGGYVVAVAFSAGRASPFRGLNVSPVLASIDALRPMSEETLVPRAAFNFYASRFGVARGAASSVATDSDSIDAVHTGASSLLWVDTLDGSWTKEMELDADSAGVRGAFSWEIPNVYVSVVNNDRVVAAERALQPILSAASARDYAVLHFSDAVPAKSDGAPHSCAQLQRWAASLPETLRELRARGKPVMLAVVASCLSKPEHGSALRQVFQAWSATGYASDSLMVTRLSSSPSVSVDELSASLLDNATDGVFQQTGTVRLRYVIRSNAPLHAPGSRTSPVNEVELLRSVVGLWQGVAIDPTRDVFSTSFRSRNVFFLRDAASVHWGVRDGDWLFSANWDGSDAMLFNLAADPDMATNLWAMLPRMTETYRRLCAAWLAREGVTLLRERDDLIETNTGWWRATELDVPGIKRVELGIRSALDAESTGVDFSIFHPYDPILVTLRSRPITESQYLEVEWRHPDGRREIVPAMLQSGSSQLVMVPVIGMPMAEGTWTVRVKQNQRSVLARSFLVSAAAPQRVAFTAQPRAIEHVVVGALAPPDERDMREFAERDRVTSRDEIIVAVDWAPGSGLHRVVFGLIGPTGQTRETTMGVRPEWSRTWLPLSWPDTPAPGLWRVVISDGAHELAQSSFELVGDAN